MGTEEREEDVEVEAEEEEEAAADIFLATIARLNVCLFMLMRAMLRLLDPRVLQRRDRRFRHWQL